MVAPSQRKSNDLGRRLRVPYHVKASLRIDGLTKPGQRLAVEICDAGELGVRIRSARELPRVIVQIQLRAPSGKQLTARGWVLHSQQLSIDLWESGIEFETPQPLLSAAQIDLADYGR